MAVSVKTINPEKFVEIAQTNQYTASGVVAIIDRVTATNVSGSATTLTINLIASGGSAGGNNTLLYQKTIQPGGSYSCPEVSGHVLNNGTSISTQAGAASSISLTISGREIS